MKKILLLAGVVAISAMSAASRAGTVAYQTGAAESNFSTPSYVTDSSSYTVQVSDNGTSYDITLHALSDVPVVGDFANLYFDTNPQDGGASGSDVGFEITNNRFFIPGGSGAYYDASPYLTYSVDTTTNTISIAIANSFFTAPPALASDPGGFPAATGDVVLRLSQSFGYSVAGGFNATSLADTNERLGSASVVSAVPLPSAASMGLGMLGLIGAAGVLRKKLRTA